ERRNAEVPSAFSLSQNTPNPFNPSTEISFRVPRQAQVRIGIYNLLGQLVRELTDRKVAPGVHRVRWDGRDSANTPVSSGVYLYRMETDAGVITKKMILLR
ncbi:MAG: T9SS type A sorting domain-containing protein, partial [Candidatus Latescibacteria bacterium]|nr:T9SS type A sorting domain-containing protein [Candidatus Latescibacterota bacterium]